MLFIIMKKLYVGQFIVRDYNTWISKTYVEVKWGLRSSDENKETQQNQNILDWLNAVLFIC